MNIDPIKRNHVDVRLDAPVTRREPSNAGSEQGDVKDQIEHSNLLDKLVDSSEIRPEVVELGRRLAEDSSYPSDDVLDKLAGMLVDEFNEFDTL